MDNVLKLKYCKKSLYGFETRSSTLKNTDSKETLSKERQCIDY